MSEKMSKTDAVLYVVDRGKATIDHLLEHDDAEMRRVLRREWLITVGATLDTARREIERLRAEVDRLDQAAAALERVQEMLGPDRDGTTEDV